jgi:TPR repeat protein
MSVFGESRWRIRRRGGEVAMIEELRRPVLCRPDRLRLQQMLTLVPWLWPDAGSSDTLARARFIAGVAPPVLRAGQVPLVTVNQGASALWLLDAETVHVAADESAARLGPRAGSAWDLAKAAVSRALPIPGVSLEIAAGFVSATHVYSLALEPEKSYVVERVIDGRSFGLSFALAIASQVFQTAVPPDIVASAEVQASGQVGQVRAIGDKLTLVLRVAPGLRRFLIAREQVSEAIASVRAAFPDAVIQPIGHGVERIHVPDESGADRVVDVVPVGSVGEAIRLAFGDRWTIRIAGVWSRAARRVVRRHRTPVITACVLLVMATIVFSLQYRRSQQDGELRLLRQDLKHVIENADSPMGNDDLRRQWIGADGERWRAAAEQEVPEAQLLAGISLWVFEGDNNAAAVRTGLRYFEGAASRGLTAAQTRLGAALRNGERVTADQPRGIALLQMAADKGDPLAMHHLAIGYEKGLGVPRSHEKAYETDLNAARLGLTFAQTATAWREFVGVGTEQNKTSACKWYRLAAAQGDIWGERGVNMCRQEQIPLDDGAAPRRTLADHESLCSLGRGESCLSAGILQAQTGDVVVSAAWFKEGCELDYLASCVKLGALALDYPSMLPDIDDSKARSLFQKACAAGLKDGCIDLAIAEWLHPAGLEDERLVESGASFRITEDERQAYTEFQRYCNEGDLRSCHFVNVAEWKLDPDRQPVIADRSRSLCDRGLVDSCVMWGLALAQGLPGLTRDDATARQVLEVACALRRHSACTSLAELLEEGRGGIRDRARARQMYQQACHAGWGNACARLLAMMFEEGVDPSTRERTEAMDTLRRSCVLKDPRLDPKLCKFLENLK